LSFISSTQMIFADRHHCAPPWVTRRQPRIATRRTLVQLCCMFACAKRLFLSVISLSQMIFADRHHCAPPWVTRRQPRIATRRTLVQLCCMFACAKTRGGAVSKTTALPHTCTCKIQDMLYTISRIHWAILQGIWGGQRRGGVGRWSGACLTFLHRVQ
jgi:hypothetical protein